MSRDLKRTRLRVWAFLTVGLVTLFLAVYAIGEKSGLFEPSSTLYVYFENLDGLVVGAPVRLSGLDIGTVDEVEFPERLEERKARVELSIKARYLPRIRTDSRASIGSKGLLGDKLIDISAGSPDEGRVADGATIPSQEAESLGELTGSVKNTLGSIRRAADQANQAIGELVTETAGKDVQRTLAGLADLVEGIRDNEGVLHTLIYDEQSGADARAMMSELRSAIAAGNRAARRLDSVLARIEQGPGGAHALLYGQEGMTIAHNLSATSEELKTFVTDARTGDGLANQLVYGEESKQILVDLAEASARLDHIMAGIEQGQGTLGGLAVDPTVYEDLKTLIGNVDRNVLLKALVRFAIKDGDLRRPAIAPDTSQMQNNQAGEPSTP